MEPIKHPQTAQLGKLKMYREDLDQLRDLFQRKCARVTISDKQFRYESFDEMKTRTGPKIDHLEIHSEQPGLHFVLNQSTQMTGYPGQTIIVNELRAEEATEEADALFGSEQEFDKRPISRGFPEDGEFGLGGGHALSLEQQVAQVFVSTPSS